MAADPLAPAQPERRVALIRLLADGRFHSGEALATALGVSRAAVWKHVREIGAQLGLRIDAVRGRGYRLAAPLELLDRDAVARGLSAATAATLAALTVVDTIGSTNAFLLGQRPPRSGLGIACLAEQQTAGRGRRGRPWVSPFGSNLYLSLLWQFELPAAALAGLSLAAGVAVAEALRALGVAEVRLKWPNDVYWQGRKLGGILVELVGEAEGPTRAVIGVGINHRMPAESAALIDQAWVDLATASPHALPARNDLVARLLDALVGAVRRFGEAGLAPFLPTWDGLDCLRGREVLVQFGDRAVSGTEVGVAASGALRVATGQGVREFLGGEVSLRAVARGEGS